MKSTLSLEEQLRLSSIRERERQRSAALHREIGGLKKALQAMPKPHDHAGWLRRKKLELKLERKVGELIQGVLIHGL